MGDNYLIKRGAGDECNKFADAFGRNSLIVEKMIKSRHAFNMCREDT